MAGDYYFAQIDPGDPKAGMGLYQHGTGKCKYYSDGGKWFYDIGTGKPAFYISDGKLYCPDGTPAPIKLG